MANTPESTPTVPTETPVDTKNIPTSVPVGPDGMTDYIRQPKAEIQGESKNFLAKLRAEVDKLIHPEQKVTSTPYAGEPVNAPNEVGVNANTTISVTANPGNTIEPNPSGNVTSPGAVPTAPGF